jgi:hypothetical protein
LIYLGTSISTSSSGTNLAYFNPFCGRDRYVCPLTYQVKKHPKKKTAPVPCPSKIPHDYTLE